MATNIADALPAAEWVNLVSVNFVEAREDIHRHQDKLQRILTTAQQIKANFPTVMVELELCQLNPQDQQTMATLAKSCLDIISVRSLLLRDQTIEFTLKLQSSD